MIKSFFSKLLNKWYIYIATIIVSIFASVYWVDFVNLPRNEETITIFMSSFNSSTTTLNEALNNAKPSYLREINIINVKPNDSTFNYQFALKGLNNADIFILPDEKVLDDFVSKQVVELNDEYIKDYLTNVTYTYENKGILLHLIGEENTDLFTFKSDESNDSNYHIFYRSNSLHIGKLNDSKYDTALLLTKTILEYGKK